MFPTHSTEWRLLPFVYIEHLKDVRWFPAAIGLQGNPLVLSTQECS